MTIEKKITISLSENDVKNIVADFLIKEGYKVSPDNVKLEVENKWVGYGQDERLVPYFKECTVAVQKDVF